MRLERIQPVESEVDAGKCMNAPQGGAGARGAKGSVFGYLIQGCASSGSIYRTELLTKGDVAASSPFPPSFCADLSIVISMCLLLYIYVSIVYVCVLARVP